MNFNCKRLPNHDTEYCCPTCHSGPIGKPSPYGHLCCVASLRFETASRHAALPTMIDRQYILPTFRFLFVLDPKGINAIATA